MRAGEIGNEKKKQNCCEISLILVLGTSAFVIQMIGVCVCVCLTKIAIAHDLKWLVECICAIFKLEQTKMLIESNRKKKKSYTKFAYNMAKCI